MGKVQFDNVANADAIQMIKPFYFGTPTFHAAPIITMSIVAIVSLVESTGVYFALGDLTNRRLSERDLAKGYRAEAWRYSSAAFLMLFRTRLIPKTSVLVQLTGIKKNAVIGVTGALLMLFYFFRKSQPSRPSSRLRCWEARWYVRHGHFLRH